MTPVNALWRPTEKCPVAGCNTYISNKYRRHWQEKHEPVVSCYKCHACLQSYSRHSSLIRHIKQKHDGEMPNRLWWPMMGCPVPQCPASTSRFKAKAYFLRHWTEKHEPEAVHYKCQFCTLTTKRKCYTAKHTLMSHGVRIDTSDTITLVKSNKEYIDPSPITLNMCLGTN
ncbi:hypothetical protein Btru_043699 [Bulinus truncatus]|nr:hypothetical protein Btru_043699 [Bulinus truncatus]